MRSFFQKRRSLLATKEFFVVLQHHNPRILYPNLFLLTTQRGQQCLSCSAEDLYSLITSGIFWPLGPMAKGSKGPGNLEGLRVNTEFRLDVEHSR